MRLLRALLQLSLCLSPALAADETAVHAVRRGETLSHVAVRHGVSIGDLRRWNGLSSDRIAVGQRLVLRPGETVTVRRGQTLSGIADDTGVPVSALRRLNGLRSDVIVPGQTLRLRSAPEAKSVPAAGDYVVRRGDTLSEIAQSRGTTVELLRAANGLPDDQLRVGQRLRLAEVPAPVAPGTVEEPPEEYVVRPGDTLSGIGLRFDVGLGLLRQLNAIDGERILPGQRLRLRPAAGADGLHLVVPGQSLSAIAALHGLDLEQLRRLNGIDGDLIRPGQKLRLRATPSTVHVVEQGDALWEIARAYGMGVDDLRQLNGLTGSRIYPGQELRVRADTAAVLDTYTVARGDNLSEIAQLHQMSVAELQRLNQLQGTVIHPGQSLRVRPLLGAGPRLELDRIPWADLLVHSPDLEPIAADNGPYYGQRPEAEHQRSARYCESHPASPLRAYRQASELWRRFEQQVDGIGRLGSTLEGWHIVLDPGHGGVDPGTIVATTGGDGQKLYVVEDEYVYDITLRVYVLLRLYGARVDITLLSPNHLFRRTSPPAATFVHEMNEVFNSLAYNRPDTPAEWPTGNARGLRERVRIAGEALRGVTPDRSIFLSFHADIDGHSPAAPLVLYYESRSGRTRDPASRAFAKALLPALGAGARTRGQSLAVLRGNPAGVKVLIEVRNLAYVDHAWALRFEQLRHRDAEKIARGVLDYVQGQRLAGR